MLDGAKRILIVAPRGPAMSTTVERLARHGWGCQVVDLLTEAKEELNKSQFEIVLAAENMDDGRGYDLTDVIARRSLSLLVGVMLSGSYLWLPTVERGVRTLGARAVTPFLLEETMEDMLLRPVLAESTGTAPPLPAQAERVLHKYQIPSRRKSAAMR
jgi:DNA-binding NtrC family response regulator